MSEALSDARVVGIDLGLRGALAALDLDGRLVALADMPTLPIAGRPDYDVDALAAWLDRQAPGLLAVGIEYVHAMPRRLGGSLASFSLGRASGLVEMWARARRVPLEIVPPRVWQRAMLPVRRGRGAAQSKQAALLTARRLFPDAPLGRPSRHGRADALLIAEYVRRLRRGAPRPGAAAR